MCLAIRTDQQPVYAKEDMTVYKCLKYTCSVAYAPVYHKRYNLGEKYTSPVLATETGGVADNESRVAAVRDLGPDWRYDSKVTLIGEGFHSCSTIERANKYRKSSNDLLEIFRCTIPKGAMYFTDTSGLLVSSEIIVNELVPEEECIIQKELKALQ